ncbi:MULTISPECIES: CGNR zinc finger domain-containing protein [unclassified Shinella]|nr:CGNR zinc finger domain-containing protein [Shinella sp. JR1-6]TAA52114.1 hypothetical protein EXZ48_30600 [Shinella sp. JR1-6]
MCHARGCDRAYIDVARNRSKIYCFETWTARMKMAEYHARLCKG